MPSSYCLLFPWESSAKQIYCFAFPEGIGIYTSFKGFFTCPPTGGSGTSLRVSGEGGRVRMTCKSLSEPLSKVSFLNFDPPQGGLEICVDSNALWESREGRAERGILSLRYIFGTN